MIASLSWKERIILLAVLRGPLVAGEPPLNAAGWVGALRLCAAGAALGCTSGSAGVNL